MHAVIQLHVDAPPKPAAGQPCNGCGVCCATEPCPAGVLVSRRTRGACAALLWREAGDGDVGGGLYRCGLVEQPARFLPKAVRWLAPALGRWARRSISAGRGCDCSLSVG